MITECIRSAVAQQLRSCKNVGEQWCFTTCQISYLSKLWKVKLNDYTQASSHLKLKVAYRLIMDMLTGQWKYCKNSCLGKCWRTWLILPYTTQVGLSPTSMFSLFKGGLWKDPAYKAGLQLACYIQERIPIIMWVTDEKSEINSSTNIAMC